MRASAAIVLLLWQLASSTGLLSPKDLAAPATILTAAWDLIRDGQLPDALLVSLRLRRTVDPRLD